MQVSEATTTYKPCTIPEGIPDYPANSPQLDPRLVKAFVIAAHANFEAVQQMVADEPGLLNASFDWGNGDFENAIEAAAHMGRRDIALHLIARGARTNLFSAAMLGELEFVKACLTAHPMLKDSLGAHGIGLLQHAKAGGEQAAMVVAWLESLG